MTAEADEIAALVIEQYNKLPAKGKPLIRSNGVHEWTVLAGIVILNRQTQQLQCVSLATGVKALPDSAIANSNGQIVHDCHAEILAIRGFNKYCSTQSSIEHIGAVHLYVCTPPCGDLSMSLVNDQGDSWTRDPLPSESELIRGRAHFNLLGRIRTKPGRADSVMSMSKSCTDKLCIQQTRSLLRCPLRQLFSTTVFLNSLVCPQLSHADFERAFSRWQPTRRFQLLETSARFEDFHPQDGKPSPCSVVWVAPNTHEVLANGIVQGSRGKSSVLSRQGLFNAAKLADPSKFTNIQLYSDLKSSNVWPPGWIRTASDDFDCH